MNVVKERLRKMQNCKKSTDARTIWKCRGADRSVLGQGWKKVSFFFIQKRLNCTSHRLQQYNQLRSRYKPEVGTDFEYPRELVEKICEGQEHPNRSVRCAACWKFVPTCSNIVILKDDSCLHEDCMQSLMSK